MYLHKRIALVSTALFTGFAAPAMAADLDPYPIVEAPMPSYEAPKVVASSGGWYLRGDAGYSLNKLDEQVNYVAASGTGMQTGILAGEIDNSYLFGAGIGYDTGHYFRADVTGEYNSKVDFTGSSSGFCTPTGGGAAVACSSTDLSSYTALTLLANAYVDLGTYHGFTPYVGAGMGGTYLKWGQLSNTIPAGFDQSGTETHDGAEEWRFTYAAMVGASVDVSANLKLDASYRYRHITGGKMFEVGDGLNGANSFTGPGHDEGITAHDFRIGARYALGGGAKASHESINEPYTPVYK